MIKPIHEPIFSASDDEEIIIRRKINRDVKLRPYQEKGYNCLGCRKRHIENKHVLQETYTSYSGSEDLTVIYPRLYTCGKEECFNMVLLKKADFLKNKKGIVAIKLPDKRDSVTCYRCNKKAHGWWREGRTSAFYTSWVMIDGKEHNYRNYCSIECFIMDSSSGVSNNDFKIGLEKCG